MGDPQPVEKDPEVEALKDRVLGILEDMKAQEVAVLWVADRTTMADYFVICTGTSDTHCRAIANDLLQKLKRDGEAPVANPERGAGSWTLIDYGGIVIHIFSREARQTYRLDHLWAGDGPTREA